MHDRQGGNARTDGPEESATNDIDREQREERGEHELPARALLLGSFRRRGPIEEVAKDTTSFLVVGGPAGDSAILQLGRWVLGRAPLHESDCDEHAMVRRH